MIVSGVLHVLAADDDVALAEDANNTTVAVKVGQRAVVKEKILPKLGGKVEFHGSNWEARADQEIAEGTVVEIIGKDNITLKVKAV